MSEEGYRFLSGEGSKMLVVFGGIMLGFGGEPVFEFGRTTKSLQAHRLMIRDHRQAWYQLGLPGVGNDLYAVVDLVKKHIEARGPERVVVTGNSAGAYAAMLVGHAVQADQILAFSPQTSIDPWFRLRVRDRRWKPHMRRIGWRRRRSETGDVRRFIGRFPPVPTTIHYARGYRLDRCHAAHVHDLLQFQMIPHGHPDHNLVERLGREGRLLPMLEEALG